MFLLVPAYLGSPGPMAIKGPVVVVYVLTIDPSDL